MGDKLSADLCVGRLLVLPQQVFEPRVPFAVRILLGYKSS